MALSVLLINLSPIETHRILVKRIMHNLASMALNGMCVCCCLILLDTLLFVNATASVSF